MWKHHGDGLQCATQRPLEESDQRRLSSLDQNAGVAAFALNPGEVRDIAPLLLDERGRLRAVPGATLASTTAQQRLLFGVRHGIYSFPTVELCDHLRELIGGRPAIEIGAGHGVLAQALGIPATDNRQQEDPAIRAYYRSLGQPTVPYGKHVEKLDAAAAVAKYKPAVVIACWVTHAYDPRRPEAGGSGTGVDEAAILAACDSYVFIGNELVHARKPILDVPHERSSPDWLFSRAMNGTPDSSLCGRDLEREEVPDVGERSCDLRHQVQRLQLVAVGVRHRHRRPLHALAQQIVIVQVQQQPAGHRSSVVDAARVVRQKRAWRRIVPRTDRLNGR